MGAFKWSIPEDSQGLICSPVFERWGRSWRLYCAKRGDSIQYGLESTKDVKRIHLALRYVCELATTNATPFFPKKKGQYKELLVKKKTTTTLQFKLLRY